MDKNTELPKRIELDETTMRLRRNLVASASAIIVIKAFDIEVINAQEAEVNREAGLELGAGVQLIGLNTENVLLILLIIMTYNFFGFIIRAIEQEKFSAKIYSDHQDFINSANSLKDRYQSQYEKMKKSTTVSAERLIKKGEDLDASKEAAQHFESFFGLMKFRFGIWDKWLAIILFVGTVYYYALP